MHYYRISKEPSELSSAKLDWFLISNDLAMNLALALFQSFSMELSWWLGYIVRSNKFFLKIPLYIYKEKYYE